MQATQIDVVAEHAAEFHRHDLARREFHRQMIEAAEAGDLHGELNARGMRDLHESLAEAAFSIGCLLSPARFSICVVELNGEDPRTVFAQDGQQ